MASENSDNRRKFQRILFDADTTIEDSSVTTPVKLIDISLNGALLQKPEEWSVAIGDEVSISIKLDQEEMFLIQMQTKVAHIEEENIGLQCIDIDMDSITHLRRLLELNIGDPELLERELVSLG